MATTLANIEADIQQAREYALLGEYDHALACFNDAVSQVERRLASPSSVASGTGPIWEPVREELLEEVRLVREVRLRLKDLDMAPASTGSAVDRDSLPVGGGARGGGGGGHIWEQRSDQRAQPHHHQHTERSQQHQQHQHQQHQQHQQPSHPRAEGEDVMPFGRRPFQHHSEPDPTNDDDPDVWPPPTPDPGGRNARCVLLGGRGRPRFLGDSER